MLGLVAWLLGVLTTAGAARAQQDPRPPDEAPSAAGEASQDEGETDAPPDPADWLFDPKAAARDWLGKPPIDPADLAARPGDWAEVLAAHGIVLDLESGTVSVRGATLHDESTLGYPIEFLVVTEMGRTHEAAIVVKAQPSVLDACLRATGLDPGTGVRYELKDPLPPEDDIMAGTVSPWIVHPAHGPLVAIEVSWIDAAGRPRATSLESLLVEVGPESQSVLADRDWIYIGSRFGEYRQGRGKVRWFKADVEGDVVAIYLEGDNRCLLERNSLDGLDDALYTLNPEVVPPRGTPVTLTFRDTGRRVEPREPIENPLAGTGEDPRGGGGDGAAEEGG